jgi:hypothetical protein
MAAVVTSAGRRSRGAHIGVSVSATSVCAAIRHPGDPRIRAWRTSLAPLNGDGSAWPGLTEALRALARDAGISNGRLSVALMPPLAEARGIDLPPLREFEMHQLLVRGAGKYFVGARGAQVVGAVRTRRAGEKATTVAAAASARLVSAIHEAARAAGWTVDGVIPAEAAWSAAAAAWLARGKGSAQLLVAHSDRTDLLQVEGSTLVGIRRFRGGASDAAIIAETTGRGAVHVGVVGNPDARRELAHGLSSRGVNVDTPSGPVPELSEQPDLLAAAFATPDAEPALVTDAMRAERAIAQRRFITRLAVAAGVLLVAAAALELWGAKRELASIDAQRAELGSQIAATIVGRTTVENAFRQLAALSEAERTSARWSAVLAQVSDRLPPEAYLTGFRGRGDTVTVDGLADRASRVFNAVEKIPTLSGVRATAPVRIETMEDGSTLERFTIAGRVAGVKAVSGRQPARPGARGSSR